MIDFKSGRLVRAVAAEQGHDLALAHVEIDAVEDVQFVIPGLQTLDLEHGLSAVAAPRLAPLQACPAPGIGLPDLRILDICGSAFANTRPRVNTVMRCDRLATT